MKDDKSSTATAVSLVPAVSLVSESTLSSNPMKSDGLNVRHLLVC